MGLAVVIGGVSIVLALQLVSTNPRFLIAVGIASVALWIGLAYVVATNIDLAFWLSSKGVGYYTAELSSRVALMVVSALLPLATAVRASLPAGSAPRASAP
jgi:hypothetical protein